HSLVDVGQLEGGLESPDMGSVGKTLRGPFEDETDEVRSLNQEWDEQKTFHGDVDAALDAKLSKVLVGEVQLAVNADAVDKMRKFQKLLSANCLLLDVRIFRVHGTEPPVRQKRTRWKFGVAKQLARLDDNISLAGLQNARGFSRARQKMDSDAGGLDGDRPHEMRQQDETRVIRCADRKRSCIGLRVESVPLRQGLLDAG